MISPPETSASPKPYTAPPSQIWAWGIGALASHFLIQTFAQASAIFTVGFGINAVVLGWAMMLPRFVDAIADPYLGHLSDNTHTKWGRRKPYLLASAFLGAIFLCAMWWANPNWSETTLLIYLAGLGTCCYLCYGLYTMSWTAVGYELTDDYNERSKVAAVAAFFLAIVSFSASWIFRVALLPIFGVSKTVDGKVVGDAVIGMRFISVAVSLVIIGAAIVAAKGCKERFTHTNREHQPLLAALKTTVKNKPFVILLLIKVCQLFGERLSGALLAYLAIYYVCSGNKELGTEIQGLAGTIGTVWSFALLPFLKPISQKIGKRAAMIVGGGISLAAALAQPFILNPKYPYLLLVTAVVVAPLLLISNTIANAVVPDICDLDELQTGERREGLFTSVMGFMAKMEISLCTLIVGYMVVWSGLNLKLTTAQNPEVLSRLFYLAIVPNIVFSLGAFLLTLKFPMTEATMTAIRHQLDERHKVHPEIAPDNEVPDETVEKWAQAN